MLDIKIINGVIIDGSGKDAYKADLGIIGDKITKIGDLSNEDAKTTIDAKDLIFFTKGPRSSGSGKLKNNSFLVLKGSTASKEQTAGIGVRNIKIIEKLLDLKILKEEDNKYIFEKDYLFSSPSAAARLVLGRSANGWTEWKTFDGKLLDEFRVKEN